MGFIFEHISTNNHAAGRLEGLRALTKLLLHEIDSLADLSPPKVNHAEDDRMNLSDSVERYEVTLICNALLESRGNHARAAKRLGMKPSTLHAKIRRYEIDSMSMFGRFADDSVPE